MLGIRSKQHDPATETATDTAPDVYPDEAGNDHALHVDGETCARCGESIAAGDECRRTASGGCVHLTC